jgi:hypothetical protein
MVASYAEAALPQSLWTWRLRVSPFLWRGGFAQARAALHLLHRRACSVMCVKDAESDETPRTISHVMAMTKNVLASALPVACK